MIIQSKPSLDELGDLIKKYESASTGRTAFKGQPIIARLDGRAFHSFTQGLEKPYSKNLNLCMKYTTERLLVEFGADVAYTQSDEITLAWYLSSDSSSEYIFGGRFQKLDSILAASATINFYKNIQTWLPGLAHKYPVFDCRTFVVPDLERAHDVFLWRQMDCIKNAISSAAQANFSHNSLQGLHSKELKAKLFDEKKINFDTDYPDYFRFGTFFVKRKEEKELSPEILEKIPESKKPAAGTLFTRNVVNSFSIELTKLQQPIDFLFSNAETNNKIIE